MKKEKQTPSYDTIAIFGNGFDLAHGYHTSYDQFISAVGKDFFADFRKHIDEYGSSSLHWYDFERQIQNLSMNCFLQSHQEGVDYEKNRQDLEKINEEFETIHDKLIAYLAKETSRIPLRRLPAIRKRLSKRTLGINFNYTDIAEKYLKHIFYVHGSLKENNIILGYDFREEPCLVNYDEMMWSKSIRRERQAFRRYISCKLKINSTDPQYRRLIQGFDEIERMQCSGKGFELEEDITEWEDKSIFDHYLKKVNRGNFLDLGNVRFDKIKTVIVLGHSIQADRQYLSALLERCVRLRKVVIFSYLGEPMEEWEKKKDFFKPYCKKIVKTRYV